MNTIFNTMNPADYQLLVCAIDNDIEGMREAVSNGADVNALDSSGGAFNNEMRIIHVVIMNQGYDTLKALLELGANPELKGNGTTKLNAIEFAVTCRDAIMVDILKSHGAAITDEVIEFELKVKQGNLDTSYKVSDPALYQEGASLIVS